MCTFFRIYDPDTIGMIDDEGDEYIFLDGKWQPDMDFIIIDKFYGMDPVNTEEENLYGNTSINDTIKIISREDANKYLIEFETKNNYYDTTE